ncbi:MAG: TonB-dependent siderophore receptor [Rhizobiaceae bacterium]
MVRLTLLRSSSVLATAAILLAGVTHVSMAQQAGEVQLDEVVISGEGQPSQAEGIVAKDAETATKSDTPLIETPRSISVVTADEIQERGGAQSYIDALSYTPGFVTTTPQNARSTAFGALRGFSVFESLYLDGMALPTGLDRANPQIEPYALERIEVLKGPASVLYGQGAPGGLINMVSKRPVFEPLREVQFQYGSFDRLQTAFDFSDKVDAAGTLAYRLTGLLQDSGTQLDFVDDDRIYIAPAFTWKPDEDTTFTLLTHYRKNTGADQYASLPNDIAPFVPTNRFTGKPGFDRNDTEQYAVGYEFNHRFNDVWQVTQTGRFLQADVDYRYLQATELTGNPDLPGEATRTAYVLDERLRAWTFDTRAQADFQTGALDHKFIAGIDYRKQNSRNRGGYYYNGGPLIDLLNPVYGVDLPEYAYSDAAAKEVEQVGLYGQEQVKWDGWVLSFGGRHDWATTVTDIEGTAYDSSSDDKAFTGNAGLLYLFDNGVAPYVSFAQSFKPEAGADVNGTPFEPTRGEQYEVGVKYQPLDYNAFVTVSAFQITQQNMLTGDLENPEFQKQIGEARVRGIEIEGKAELGNFDLTASYSHLDSQITKDTYGNEGNRLAYVPEHTASAWIDYHFQSAAWDGLSLGAGVRYVGSFYGDHENTVLNDDATYLDLSAQYQFGRRWSHLDGLALDVSVTNVTDRKTLICDGPWGCEWGKRRAAYATLSYKW